VSRNLSTPLIAFSIESNLYFTNKLAFRAGARYENSQYTNQSTIAPRFSLAYKLSAISQVSAGYGIFYQLPEYNYLNINKNLEFETATHFVVNYQAQKEKRTFRTEAYYKKYSNLVKEFNSPEPILNNDGVGYARGIDFFFRDSKSLKYADYWITYSFLDTERDYKDFPVQATPTFASGHVINAVGKYFIAKLHLSTGVTYTYARGRTYFNPNNPEFLSDKTKDYHNFSANLSYLTHLGEKFTIIYLSVENVFGIKNVFGYRYSPDGSIRKPVEPSAPRNIFIGMFITFGDDNFR